MATMRNVAVLLHADTRLFDFAVVHEVFGVDRRHHGLPAFMLRRCAHRRRAVTAESGIRIGATHDLAALATADLVVVPGAEPAPARAAPAEIAALRAAAAAGVPIAALCSGAFVLAAAGLLAGQRATTHWALVPQLAHEHPDVTVVNGPLWIEADRVFTSAPRASTCACTWCAPRTARPRRPTSRVAW
jgi:transcriptional regulator GlxA family with amidase domain